MNNFKELKTDEYKGKSKREDGSENLIIWSS